MRFPDIEMQLRSIGIQEGALAGTHDCWAEQVLSAEPTRVKQSSHTTELELPNSVDPLTVPFATINSEQFAIEHGLEPFV
eukprot:COSAG05_NODE_7485_length_805_cov_0.922096_2_plen_80_part_00